jgi:ATP-dependent DNA helicase RecG
LQKDETTTARLDSTRHLEVPVTSLRFVSARYAARLAQLDIYTVRDLLMAIPFRYNDFSQVVPIAQVHSGARACVQGVVDEVEMRVTRRRCRVVEVSLVDASGVMKAAWFNQPWIAQTLKKGTRVFLQGTVEHAFGFWQMSAPLFSVVSEDTAAGAVVPVYHATSELTTTRIARFEYEACRIAQACIDPIPVALRRRNALMARGRALCAVHLPVSLSEVEAAHDRLRYEELFFLQLHLAVQRNLDDRRVSGHAQLCRDEDVDTYRSAFPFEFTSDQAVAFDDIRGDMAASRPMRRMLFGDVGSGKTAVAAGAAFIAARAGHQVAIMAPTEVLVSQYETAIGAVLDHCGVSWDTLSSSTSPAHRSAICARLEAGDLSVVFGTHALLEEDVRFADLTLVIIDEQHRFGVEQRARLADKRPGCDQLYLTATPIPRSLALTLYSDMQSSFLDTVPARKAPVSTRVLPKTDHFTAYEAVREAVAAGHQAYIVCPLIASREQTKQADPIDVSDETAERLYAESPDDSGRQDLRAARREASYLQDQVFPDARVGLLCGSMKASDKAESMQRFRAGETDILVSTTVIEVGVDVPNATVMVIEDAERFGLAQLHQLRGRVGRGAHPGSVFLMAAARSEVAHQRMEAMERLQSGFDLARLDLSLRQEGDLTGYRQHGDNRLSLVNVVRDTELIERVWADVSELLVDDPCLEDPVHAHLVYELSVLFPEES